MHDGRWVLVYVITSDQAMGRIYVLKLLTSTFSVSYIWAINSDTVKYQLLARRKMDAPQQCLLELERVSWHDVPSPVFLSIKTLSCCIQTIILCSILLLHYVYALYVCNRRAWWITVAAKTKDRRLSLQMDLIKKFADVNACYSVHVSSLQVDCKYPITQVERVSITYGPTIVLSIRDSLSRITKVFCHNVIIRRFQTLTLRKSSFTYHL
jgi:hypothetical protein